MSVNKAKLFNLRKRLLDVANALDSIDCEDCDRTESIYMSKREAMDVLAHALEYGTRGLKKSQMIKAWEVLRK
jgi:hypothetical protein